MPCLCLSLACGALSARDESSRAQPTGASIGKKVRIGMVIGAASLGAIHGVRTTWAKGPYSSPSMYRLKRWFGGGGRR